MKLEIRLKHRILNMGLFVVLMGGIWSSCQYDYEPEKEVEKPENIYMSTSVNFKDVRSPQNDAEERINSVRLIICDSQTGEVIYNVRHQHTDFKNQPVGENSVWHSPFAISPGFRDFFFIANEDSWSLTTQLQAIANKTELYTNKAFTHLPYRPNFKPTLEYPMLLTQAYFNVNVESTRNGKGTQADPQHFIAEGDEVVDFIRTLAKIKLTLKEVAYVEENELGQMKATRLKFKQLQNFEKLALGEVPSYFSLFVNPYFKSLSFLPGKYYTSDFYGTASDAKQEYVVESAGAVNHSEAIYTTPSLDPISGLTTYYDYVTTLYVPEHLRAFASGENAVGLNPAGAMVWRFYNNTGTPYYKSSIDHQNWNNPPETGNNTFFTLPDAATRYSRYSVLRNNFYDITAEERGYKFYLNYDVKPWVDEAYAVYVGDYYNVWIEDPTFTKNPQKVRIVTSKQNSPIQFDVKLVAAIGQNLQFTQTGTTVPLTQASHVNPAYQTHTDYTLNVTSTPSQNSPVILIKFNNKVVYTIKKQEL